MIRYFQDGMVINMKTIYSQNFISLWSCIGNKASGFFFLSVKRLITDAPLFFHLLVVHNNENKVHLQSFMSVCLWFPKIYKSVKDESRMNPFYQQK